jgi:hypothetical protein
MGPKIDDLLIHIVSSPLDSSYLATRSAGSALPGAQTISGSSSFTTAGSSATFQPGVGYHSVFSHLNTHPEASPESLLRSWDDGSRGSPHAAAQKSTRDAVRSTTHPQKPGTGTSSHSASQSGESDSDEDYADGRLRHPKHVLGTTLKPKRRRRARHPLGADRQHPQRRTGSRRTRARSVSESDETSDDAHSPQKSPTAVRSSRRAARHPHHALPYTSYSPIGYRPPDFSSNVIHLIDRSAHYRPHNPMQRYHEYSPGWDRASPCTRRAYVRPQTAIIGKPPSQREFPFRPRKTVQTVLTEKGRARPEPNPYVIPTIKRRDDVIWRQRVCILPFLLYHHSSFSRSPHPYLLSSVFHSQQLDHIIT